MIVIRIPKVYHRGNVIHKLLGYGFKKDEINSMTQGRIHCIYLHDDIFELMDINKCSKKIREGAFDCKLDKELFLNKAYDMLMDRLKKYYGEIK